MFSVKKRKIFQIYPEKTCLIRTSDLYIKIVIVLFYVFLYQLKALFSQNLETVLKRIGNYAIFVSFSLSDDKMTLSKILSSLILLIYRNFTFVSFCSFSS